MHLQLLPLSKSSQLCSVTVPHVSHENVGPCKTMTFLRASQDLTRVFAAVGASVEPFPVRAGAARGHVRDLDCGHISGFFSSTVRAVSVVVAALVRLTCQVVRFASFPFLVGLVSF